MVELIKNTEFTVTETLWKDFRNPSDKYLIEFTFVKNGIKLRDRRTTNNLTRFIDYLNKSYPSWTWMNVFFRYTDLEASELKTAQIAAYTKRRLPEKEHPTIEEINSLLNFLNELGNQEKTEQSYQAGLAFVELVLK